MSYLLYIYILNTMLCYLIVKKYNKTDTVTAKHPKIKSFYVLSYSFFSIFFRSGSH